MNESLLNNLSVEELERYHDLSPLDIDIANALIVAQRNRIDELLNGDDDEAR